MISLSNVSQSSFWQDLNKLKDEIRSKISATKVLERIKQKENNTLSIHGTKITSREEIMSIIESYVKEFLNCLRERKLPKFVLNKRGGTKNTKYTEERGMEMLSDVTKHGISLEHESSLNKYTVMLSCLSICYKLLQSNKHSTKRDVYYSNVNIFQNQHVVDEAITDISCMLGVSRHSLNILSSSKGFIYGSLTFKDHDGNVISCKENGVQIPNHIGGIHCIISDARYILVIEKEATYQRLVEYRLSDKLGPCILLTGKGFPDINTRLLLRKLWEELEIPVFAFVDADPHGIEIMCIYKYGSKSLSYEAASLTCPSLKWLGIHPKDTDVMNISNSVMIPLSNADRKKASDLLKRPYIIQQPKLIEQIELLLKHGLKAEIECLDSISHSFMTDIYLPYKLRNGHWL